MIDPKDKSCHGHKNSVQGCSMKCGDREWGPGSEIWLCEKCLKKEIKKLKGDKLQWQDQPTTDGYYWVANIDFSNIQVVRLRTSTHEFDGCESKVVFKTNGDNAFLSLTSGKWYGPITPPKED